MSLYSPRVFGVSQEKGIPPGIFLNVVGQLKFRGTSTLCRLSHSPVNRSTPLPPDAPQPVSPAPSPNASLNRKPVQPDIDETIKEEPTPESGSKKARMESSPSDKEELMDYSNSDEVSIDSNKSPPSIAVIGEDDSIGTLSDGESDMEGLPGQDYNIATHFVKVRRSGTLSDVTTIWDLQGTDCISGSLDSIVASKPGFDRLPSINAFDRVRTKYMYM